MVNKYNHKVSDGFEIRSDQTLDCGVSCPCASEKSMYNVVTTLAPSFLIGSFSFLQAKRTAKKSWMVLKFRKIGPVTAE